MDANLSKKIDGFLKKHGNDALLELLEKYIADEDDDDDVLTVVASEDIHNIPQRAIRGEKYVIHCGSFDTQNLTLLNSEVEKSLLKLVKKLKEKNWNTIYLIPSGFPELFIMAKLLIYRVTRIDSVDMIYIGNGKYHNFQFNTRGLCLKCP